MSTNVMTAERQFEAGHLRRLRWAFLGATGIHLILFLILPHPGFQPYQLAEQTITRLVDAPLAIVIPPPPKEIPKQDVVTAMVPSDDPGAEETMPSTALDPTVPLVASVSNIRPRYFDAFDQPPVVVKRVYPVYPEMARQAELEGVVVLKVAIDEFGQVKEVLVLQSVDGLDEAAMDAIYQWQFKPAEQRGVPVPVWFAVPIRFSLRG
ncbi:energy transducer TonB [bacterium]|nr:energy transducer TonB [bacterium]